MSDPFEFDGLNIEMAFMIVFSIMSPAFFTFYSSKSYLNVGIHKKAVSSFIINLHDKSYV